MHAHAVKVIASNIPAEPKKGRCVVTLKCEESGGSMDCIFGTILDGATAEQIAAAKSVAAGAALEGEMARDFEATCATAIAAKEKP